MEIRETRTQGRLVSVEQRSSTIAGTPDGAADGPPLRRAVAVLIAAAAGLCWAAALALLLFGGVDGEADPWAPRRILFYLAVLLAGLLTFVPVQRALGIPGLAFEGIAGVGLLFYTVAFVPAPTAWLLALPDLAVYLLLAAAVFWSVSAIATPLTYALGQRLFRQRARRYDLRRARRQAHEIGGLAALCVGLAGLRLLTPLSVVLLALIMIVAELLFLSFVETET